MAFKKSETKNSGLNDINDANYYVKIYVLIIYYLAVTRLTDKYNYYSSFRIKAWQIFPNYAISHFLLL